MTPDQLAWLIRDALRRGWPWLLAAAAVLALAGYGCAALLRGR